MAKSRVRKEISKLLENLSQLEKDKQSELVFERLISHAKYKQAKRISIYLSTNNEISTEPILRRALEVDQKRCYVPLVLKKSIQGTDGLVATTRMVMYELRSMSEYEQLPLNHYGIKEPNCVDSRILESPSLDLVITPGVAFDRSGRRLGHGKGYYDEFFTNSKASLYTIGLAFREQILDEEELPFDETSDVRLDEILTSD